MPSELLKLKGLMSPVSRPSDGVHRWVINSETILDRGIALVCNTPSFFLELAPSVNKFWHIICEKEYGYFENHGKSS